MSVRTTAAISTTMVYAHFAPAGNEAALISRAFSAATAMPDAALPQAAELASVLYEPVMQDSDIGRAAERLNERIAQLPERARTAFWCLCAEALMPLHERFVASVEWGSTEPLREAVDLAWSQVETGRLVEPADHHSQLLEVAPDDEDFEGRGRDAQNAAICAEKALYSAAGKDPGNDVWFVLEPQIASLEDRDFEGRWPRSSSALDAWEGRLAKDPAISAALDYLQRLVEQLPTMNLTADEVRMISGADALRPGG